MKPLQLIKNFAKKLIKKLTNSSSSSSINPSDLERIDDLSSIGSRTVLLVRHRPTNQLYALKIIYGFNEEIAREIEILRTTDNPFIIRCIGIFHSRDDIRILLEYMDKGHIGRIGRVPESTLANITYQILQGLAYLHGQKIIHRDLKPENILINGQNEVKISDFGLSRFLTGEIRICSSVVGTIKYMSPERLEKEPYDGYASDIWSFGISILECHLGRFPVGVYDNYSDCIMHGTFSGESPANTSEKFKSFIKCCLKIEPSERWTAQQLLNHPFITERDGGGNAQPFNDRNPQAASSSSSIHRHP
ncbi:mitogen-activated protein kinase kinase 5-like [Magnolia sinica]|uniref:mitogen-activated protein kinase kinase 5-like n=1 Tax=Magnolia sinica TaxID=86752 RepID=UPI002658D138|nr:mitogen-activated protein kinase kinase 5-like [Magnolia sinica]